MKVQTGAKALLFLHLACRGTMEAPVRGERTDLRGSKVKRDLWEKQEVRASPERRWDIKNIWLLVAVTFIRS